MVRVELSSADQRVLVWHAIVADQDDVRCAAYLAELTCRLLCRQNAILRSAPLDVNASQVRIGAERCLGIADSGRGVPFRCVLHDLEIWIVRFEVLHAAIGAILAVQRGKVALKDGDLAGLGAGMGGNVLAGVLRRTPRYRRARSCKLCRYLAQRLQ